MFADIDFIIKNSESVTPRLKIAAIDCLCCFVTHCPLSEKLEDRFERIFQVLYESLCVYNRTTSLVLHALITILTMRKDMKSRVDFEGIQNFTLHANPMVR